MFAAGIKTRAPAYADTKMWLLKATGMTYTWSEVNTTGTPPLERSGHTAVMAQKQGVYVMLLNPIPLFQGFVKVFHVRNKQILSALFLQKCFTLPEVDPWWEPICYRLGRPGGLLPRQPELAGAPAHNQHGPGLPHEKATPHGRAGRAEQPDAGLVLSGDLLDM